MFNHKPMQIQNAIITDAILGIKDHGVLTIMIFVDYGGSGQGFGGVVLDEYSKEKNKRVGHRLCGDWILGILKATGKESRHELSGTNIRVEREDGYQGKKKPSDI